jgi:hypothetical protein
MFGNRSTVNLDIFLSYAHADKERALLVVGALEKRGYRVWWDRDLVPGDLWQPALLAKITQAAKVLLLWSQAAARSVHVAFEVKTALDQLKLVPICLDEQPRKLLTEAGAFAMSFEHVQHLTIDDLDRQSVEIVKALDHNPLSSLQIASRALPRTATEVPFRLANLPETSGTLFGRTSEQRMLRDAWIETQTKVLVLEAMGGTGKTALLNWFLHDLAERKWPGAERVYGWSFYSQGSSADRQSDADIFFRDALSFFGHDIDAHPIKSSRDKGLRLAELIQQQRSLVVLDGLEPLQELPIVNRGRLRDAGLAALIKQLAKRNPGLLLLTTRQPVHELEGLKPPLVILHTLNQLDEKASVELLQHTGVNGRTSELRQAAREYGYHALALTLLGNYLSTVYGGAISKRHEVPGLFEEAEQGGHATRVMLAYVRRFMQMQADTDRPGTGAAELAILHMVGLFDRPAPSQAIEALLAPPEIVGLTDTFHHMRPHERTANWSYALRRARALRLLNPAEAGKHELDAHPLVREYFGKHLMESNEPAFRQAHDRLFAHFSELPKEHKPSTAEEIAMLVSAVRHGCRSGRVGEAYRDVYRTRLERERDRISTALFSYGTELGVLAGFYVTPWTKFEPALKTSERFHLFTAVGECLSALGRAQDVFSICQSIDTSEACRMVLAAKFAEDEVEDIMANLSEEQVREAAQALSWGSSEAGLVAGHLHEILTLLEKLVEPLLEPGQRKMPELYNAACLYAIAAAMSGRYDTYQRLHSIGAAEKGNTRFPISLAIDGYHHWDWLTLHGDRQGAVKSLDAFLAHGSQLYPDEVAAFAGITRGTLQLMDGRCEAALPYLNEACDGLVRSQNHTYLPFALILRARCHRLLGDLERAAADLDEAREIAEYGGMRLWLADYNIEAAYLALRNGGRDEAKVHAGAARRLIELTGYGRRAVDQDLVDAHVAFAFGRRAEASGCLESARTQVEKHRLLGYAPEITALESLLSAGRTARKPARGSGVMESLRDLLKIRGR